MKTYQDPELFEETKNVSFSSCDPYSSVSASAFPNPTTSTGSPPIIDGSPLVYSPASSHHTQPMGEIEFSSGLRL